MAGSAVSEDSLAEQPALRWLCGEGVGVAGVGWDYLHGTALAPDAPAGERARWSDVALRGRLERAVRRINPHLPAEAVERACEIALASTSPLIVENHRSFHELLLSGVPVAYRDPTGVERNDHARLVDFDELEQNDFLAVNQLTIIEGGKHRRPDVLLYVNGSRSARSS